MGWGSRGNQVARAIASPMHTPIVPESLFPRLLELWDESGRLVPSSGNKPLTKHARIMWAARAFVRDPQVIVAMRLTHGVLPGQASVFVDLCVHLDNAQKIAQRLKI